LIAGDTFTWDAEIGRRYLGNVYDSKIEFGSIFDGALVRFGKAFDNIGDFYVNAAAFLVNDKWNQYGEVIEIGALRVANLGLNLKLLGQSTGLNRAFLLTKHPSAGDTSPPSFSPHTNFSRLDR
jgi:hypothetical protein